MRPICKTGTSFFLSIGEIETISFPRALNLYPDSPRSFSSEQDRITVLEYVSGDLSRNSFFQFLSMFGFMSFSEARVFEFFSPFSNSITRSALNLDVKFLLFFDNLRNLFSTSFHFLFYPSEQKRPDVKEKRKDWKEEQPAMPTGSLVFLDESGTNLNMTRPCAWKIAGTGQCTFEYASNYNNTVFHTNGRKNGERGISRCARRSIN